MYNQIIMNAIFFNHMLLYFYVMQLFPTFVMSAVRIFIMESKVFPHEPIVY